METKIVNKWNINMNTLNQAKYDIAESIKVWGFVVEENKILCGRIFLEETACVRSWYNWRCTEARVSIMQSKEITKTVVDEKDLDIFGIALMANPVMLTEFKKNLIAENADFDEGIVRHTFICLGFSRGAEKNKMSYVDMKNHGYGLIYWEHGNVCTFFDNRFVGTMRRLKELQAQNIRPICIKIKKTKNVPIPVADGRNLLTMMAEQQSLQKFYAVLQTY